MTDDESHEHGSTLIHIDHDEFRVPTDDMTGAQLRQVPYPPIGADRDLWLEVPGGQDQKIEDDQLVELKDGMHFFTAPATINPGRDARSS